MTKKRNGIVQVINIISLYIGLIFYFFMHASIYYLLGILILSPLVAKIIGMFLPVYKKNSNKTKQNNTKKQNKSSSQNAKINKNFSTSKKLHKEHNLLRSEGEILTLPIEELTWREFERLCFLYYKSKGYKPRETSEGSDGGVDIIIYNRHHQTDVAIQIKHYSNPVTVEHIRQLDSAKKNHKCMLAEFITTSTYTTAASREASDRKIVIHDRMWVENKILKWRDQEAQKRTMELTIK